MDCVSSNGAHAEWKKKKNKNGIDFITLGLSTIMQSLYHRVLIRLG